MKMRSRSATRRMNSVPGVIAFGSNPLCSSRRSRYPPSPSNVLQICTPVASGHSLFVAAGQLSREPTHPVGDVLTAYSLQIFRSEARFTLL